MYSDHHYIPTNSDEPVPEFGSVTSVTGLANGLVDGRVPVHIAFVHSLARPRVPDCTTVAVRGASTTRKRFQMDH